MRRRITTLLGTLALLLPATANAQTAVHELSVMVPDVLGIRLVGPGAGPRGVIFDYGSDAQAYLTAVDEGSDLLPTVVQRFENVQVRAVRNGRWSLHVVATPFTYVGPTGAQGLLLSEVRVHRGVRSGLVQDAIVGHEPGGGTGGSRGGGSGNAGSFGYLTAWSLSSDAQEIAWRSGSTGGWRSLGFSGSDYALTVDGDEASGTYTTTVTYFLTFP